MSEEGLLIAVVVIFAYTLVAQRLSTGIVTAPMIFLAMGWGLSEFDLITTEGAEGILHTLAEVTLVILLFSDAARTNLTELRKSFAWSERMLLLGLPLTIALGVIAGSLLLPGWGIWEVAVLAAILAPTDAALGQAVVSIQAVPERVRKALTVESGLNDGLALPAVLFFACIAVGGVHDNVQTNWLAFAGQQIGYGIAMGVITGLIGGWAMQFAAAHGLSNDAYEGVGVLALAGASYLVAVHVGGNGFIAAFSGGLAFGAMTKGRCAFVLEFMETEGQALIMATFLLVGAVLLPEALMSVDVRVVLLILISLAVVRPAAIWISLWSANALPVTRLFVGWFGPRGLATVLFGLVVTDQFSNLRHGHEILMIATLCVAISAVLHGASAAPLARWYARHIAMRKGGETTRSRVGGS